MLCLGGGAPQPAGELDLDWLADLRHGWGRRHVAAPRTKGGTLMKIARTRFALAPLFALTALWQQKILILLDFYCELFEE